MLFEKLCFFVVVENDEVNQDNSAVMMILFDNHEDRLHNWNMIHIQDHGQRRLAIICNVCSDGDD